MSHVVWDATSSGWKHAEEVRWALSKDDKANRVSSCASRARCAHVCVCVCVQEQTGNHRLLMLMQPML
eukprot:1160997-Pelagomonas_calceolata.AAC.25